MFRRRKPSGPEPTQPELPEGELPPRQAGYQPPAAFSNNLQGCSAYRAGDHWHYISYGLSELYVPAPEDDPEFSGWGFELTLRVPGDESEPPHWPFTMINEMAKHVNSNLAPLHDGDRIDLRVPITGFPNLPGAPDTGLTVFTLCVDRELGQSRHRTVASCSFNWWV